MQCMPPAGGNSTTALQGSQTYFYFLVQSGKTVLANMTPVQEVDVVAEPRARETHDELHA